MLQSFPINPADIAIVIVVIMSGVFAFARGFIREVLSLASWVGAILVTFWGYTPARAYVARLVGSDGLPTQLGVGAGLFLISLIVFSMLAGGLASLVRVSSLNALDRSLGFVFGLVRGALLVAVLWLGTAWVIKEQRPDWLVESRLLPMVEQFADFLRGLAPPEFRAKAQAAGDSVRGGVRQVEQYESILRAPATPQAKTSVSSSETGYKSDERRGLEGLIQRAEPTNTAPSSR